MPMRPFFAALAACIFPLVLLYAAPLMGQAATPPSQAPASNVPPQAPPEDTDAPQPPAPADTLVARVADLERRAGHADLLAIREKRALTIYGDVGLRWQGVFNRGEYADPLPGGNEINGPEYRVRFGAAGYLHDSDKHRFKFDVRLSTVGQGDYPAPMGAPTVSWRPTEDFGSFSGVAFDRWSGSHTYKQYLRGGLGRFGSIFHGSPLIFDDDLGLTGIFAIFDVGVASKLYDAGPIDDWSMAYDDGKSRLLARIQLKGAAYYLARNNLSLASPDAEQLPIGFSLQMPVKLRVARTDTALMVVPGFHSFEGEQAIASNIGTGTSVATTNVLGPSGLVYSEFHIGELYLSLTLFEERDAALHFYAHGIQNLGFNKLEGVKEPVHRGYTGGIEWGAQRLEQRGDFRLSFIAHYIEADATIPEFNDETLNTNSVGYTLTFRVNILPTLTMFASWQESWREDERFGGVGRRSDGTPGNPSNDRESRYRAGFSLRF